MTLKDNLTGNKPIYETIFNIKIEQNILVVSFVCEHPSMNSFSNRYNDELYKGDVVEIFIQSDKKDEYLEIEVAPNNTHFLAIIHNDGHSFKNIGFVEEDFITSNSSFLNGKWEVTIYIPLNKISLDWKKGVKYNAFRIETDNEKSEKHLFALNPTRTKTFHIMNSFVKLL